MVEDEFPIRLNATDDEGRVVYADGRGGAYVLVPHPPGAAPMTTGAFFGTSKTVPRPASMRDPFFDAHPGTVVEASADGATLLVRPNGGNPPPPPLRLPCPPSLRAVVAEHLRRT